MDTIIDIKTNKTYNLFSKQGKKLLKSYVKLFNKFKMLGGMNNSPVNLMPPQPPQAIQNDISNLFHWHQVPEDIQAENDDGDDIYLINDVNYTNSLMISHDNSNLLDEPHYYIYFQDNLTVQQLKHKIAEYFDVEENNITINLNQYNDEIDDWGEQQELNNDHNINNEHFNTYIPDEDQFISFTTPPPPFHLYSFNHMVRHYHQILKSHF